MPGSYDGGTRCRHGHTTIGEPTTACVPPVVAVPETSAAAAL